MKKLLLLVLIAAVLYLTLAPTKVEPVAWTAPPAPSTKEGSYAVNDKLKGVQRIAQIDAVGPESVVIDSAGVVYTGYVDGRVVRFAPDGGNGEVLANTGGRPLGVALAPGGGLFVADANRGLLQIDDKGGVKLLAEESDGLRFGFTDDLSTDSAGEHVYFSDASSKFGFGHHMEDIIEHGANGRLLRYDIATGKTTTLLNGLHFANGVAVGPNDEFVLVNETSEYRVMRYWLKGDKAGTAEPFIENLPGFPDNITFNGKDRFWLALAAPRDDLLDQMADKPFVRKMVARLPAAIQPKPKRHALALALDLNGKVVANLQDASEGAFSPVTSVREFGPWIYFGSLSETSLARLPLNQAFPDSPPAPAGWEKVPGPYELNTPPPVNRVGT